MQPIKLWWTSIALILLLTLLDSTQQAIVSRLEHELPSALGPRLSSEDEPRLDSLEFARKFIILTTGKHISIYPLPSVSNNDSSNTLSSDFHYSVIPLEIDVNDSAFKQKFGNTKFSRWVEVNSLQEKSQGPKSILPAGDSEKPFFAGDSGWIEPIISDVDYFFDLDFCFSEEMVSDSQCLVIVWLDTQNKFIRLGSIDLLSNPIYAPDNKHSTSGRHNRKPKGKQTLWLREFPPIDLIEAIRLNSGSPRDESLQVLGMAVDKRRAVLHVTLGDNQHRPQMVLSGGLRCGRSELDETQLDGQSVHYIEKCQNEDDQTSIDFMNMEIDEGDGDLLYFFDRRNGGQIFAMHLKNNNFISRKSEWKNSNTSLVLVTHTSSECNLPDILGGNRVHLQDRIGAPIGVTLEPNGNRMYYLAMCGELHSCDLAGHNAEIVGHLPLWPPMRSPRSIRYFDGSIYFADDLKKSLVAYKLPERNSFGGKTDSSQTPQLNYQVLLVAESKLLGFRLASVDQSAKSMENSQGWSIVDVKKAGRNIYQRDPRIQIHARSRLGCTLNHLGFLHLTSERVSSYILIDILALYVVFIIWLILPWFKRKVNSNLWDETKTYIIKKQSSDARCPV